MTSLSSTDLMDAPEGTTRVGDEYHADEHWTECESCGYDNPVDHDTCTFCGATLEEAEG